jgi:hypothetical protein
MATRNIVVKPLNIPAPKDILKGGRAKLETWRTPKGKDVYVNIYPKGIGDAETVRHLDIATVTAGTSLSEIFAKAGAIERDFDFLGEHFHAVMRHEGVPTVISVALHETFTHNVVSGIGVKKKPFVTFKVGEGVKTKRGQKSGEFSSGEVALNTLKNYFTLDSCTEKVTMKDGTLHVDYMRRWANGGSLLLATVKNVDESLVLTINGVSGKYFTPESVYNQIVGKKVLK